MRSWKWSGPGEQAGSPATGRELPRSAHQLASAYGISPRRVRSSTTEPSWQERPVRETAQGSPHPLERWLRGQIASQVALLFCVHAQVEQLLAEVALTADIRPLPVVQGSQRPGLPGQTPGIAIERVVRDHLGQRGIGGCTLERRRRRSPVPKTGQRRPGKRRAGLKTEHVDDRRRQVPQAHRLSHDLFGRATPRGNDQKGNVQLGLIETRTVAENAGVLAETLPVVRG